MKKFVMHSILTSLFCLLIISCKETSKKKSEPEVNTKELNFGDKDILKNGEDLITDVPSFENSAVQDYVDSYEAYLKDYAKAVEGQDIEALSNLGPKGQELSMKAQEVSGNMSVEDAQKFTHYMTEKAKVIQELTLKMSK